MSKIWHGLSPLSEYLKIEDVVVVAVLCTCCWMKLSPVQSIAVWIQLSWNPAYVSATLYHHQSSSLFTHYWTVFFSTQWFSSCFSFPFLLVFISLLNYTSFLSLMLLALPLLHHFFIFSFSVMCHIFCILAASCLPVFEHRYAVVSSHIVFLNEKRTRVLTFM